MKLSRRYDVINMPNYSKNYQKRVFFPEQKWQFLRIFRLIIQLGVTYRSKNFFKLGVILLFNTVWNIKAISFYKRPQNSFKWWLEISIFWNIGQLCTQFSGSRIADIKKLLWSKSLIFQLFENQISFWFAFVVQKT